MRQDQHTLVICVSPGLKGRWDVSEKGLEEPLASFDEKEDAYAYANDLRNNHAPATVLVEDREGFFLMPSLDENSFMSGAARGSSRGFALEARQPRLPSGDEPIQR